MPDAAAVDASAATEALEQMFEKAAAARKPQDIEWVLDAAFYCGLQYTTWNVPAGRFEEIPRPTNRPNAPRPIANKIASLTMDAWASMKSYDLAVEIKAPSSDSMDISNARVEQAWVDYIQKPCSASWLARKNAALFWVALCGEGWLKWTIAKNFVTSKLETRIEACSPLDVYLQPNVDSYLDANWLIHVKGMEAEDVYNLLGADLEASSVDSQDVLKTKIMREIGMVSGTPTVTVKELWQLPSRRHPAGRHIIWTRDRVLLREDFPYKHRMLPFTQIGHSPIPGSPHYSSGTRIARPLQMELNQYHAQKITARNNFANHKWAVDSVMAASMQKPIDDSPNQVLICDTQAGRIPFPAILQAQMWPDSQDGVWIGEELDDAVGLHDVSRGEAPGRVDSAQGIENLQDADKSRTSEVKDTMSVAMYRGFKMCLSLAKQFVTDEQMIPAYGRNGAVQVHRFKTDSFSDDPVIEITQGGLPTGRAARRAEVMTMWSAGLLGADPSRALDLLDYPSDVSVSPDERDELEAVAENMLMALGQPVTPKPWQNHEIHRRIHDEYRKSAEFAAAKDQVWNVFEHHDVETNAAELADMREAAERQKAIDDMLAEVFPPAAPPLPGAPAQAAGGPDTGDPESPLAPPPPAPAGGAPNQPQPQGQGLPGGQ
jgi:hypothetical protein